MYWKIQMRRKQMANLITVISENRNRPVFKTLTERQKEVICYFFGIGVDHPDEPGRHRRKINLTRERVRQIKDKAITKLRTTNRCKPIKNLFRRLILFIKF